MSKMADALDVVSLPLSVSHCAAGVAACVNVCCVLRCFLLLLSRLMRGAPIRKVGQHCERDN